jgi:DNA invertase Pin-like site-specific DNA recombinase
MAVYFYSRVSTDMQTVENQKELVKSTGQHIDYWFSDEGVSGGVPAFDRPQFAAMVAQMEPDSTIVTTSVDRIGRNTVDVIQTIEKLAKMGISVFIMTFGKTDLTSEVGMMILTIGAAFAQMEKTALKRRTKDGMARVKAAGVKLGQPLKITPTQMKEMLQMQREGDSINKIALAFDLPRNTVDRNLTKWVDNYEGYVKEYEDRQAQYKESKSKKENNEN